MTGSRPRPLAALEGAAACAVLLAACGLWAAPSTLPDFDGAEFALLSLVGGVAHPPGYPLYVALLRAAAGLRGPLPLLPVLAAVSWLSVAAAGALMHRTLTGQGLPARHATLAILACATSAPAWRVATGIEPLGLNLLLASGVVAVSTALWGGRHPGRHALVGGMLMGLGVANHHTLILLLPFLLVAMVRGHGGVRSWASFAAGALVGATPLLLLLPPHGPRAWVYGDWSNPWSALWGHVLRRNYGTFALAPGAQGGVLDGPLVFVQHAPGWLTGVFLLAALVGGYAALRGRAPGPVVAAGGTALLAGLVLPLLFRRGSTELEVMLVQRFMALPLWLLAPVVAWGLLRAEQRLGRVVMPLAVLSLGVHVVVQSVEADRGAEQFVERHVRNLVKIVEPPALLVTSSDHDTWGLMFARETLGLNDLELLPAGLAHSPWYMGPLAARLGMSPSQGGVPSPADVLRHALRTRRVYLLDASPAWVRPWVAQAWPLGPLYRVEPEVAEVPGASEVFRRNIALVSVLQQPSGPPSTLNAVEKELARRYAAPWEAIRDAMAEAGHFPEAGMCDLQRAQWTR